MGSDSECAACGPRGFGFPEAILAMGFGRGWGRRLGPRLGRRDWGGLGRRLAAGRGRRRMFDAGELRLVLLKLIADQPRHGYDLIRAIEELTHGAYAPSPGVVYPTLTMLQDMGLIEEAKGEGSRKAFQVTAEGEAHLAEKAEEVDGPARAARGSRQRPAQGRRRADQARGRQSALRALAPRHPRGYGRGDAARDRRHPRRGGAEDRTAEMTSSTPVPTANGSRYCSSSASIGAQSAVIRRARGRVTFPRRARRRLAGDALSR